jgi:hypothetical protein
MARFVEVIIGPKRVSSRSIFCRACATDVSLRTDGTWRHDADGTPACVDPAQLYRDADTRTTARTLSPCTCCGSTADRARRTTLCVDCAVDGCEPSTPCKTPTSSTSTPKEN